jgi:hypothetical protein
MTLTDALDRLKQLDEITLMEILEISSEDIVDRFVDVIEDKLDQLEEDLEADLPDGSGEA